MLFNFFYSKSLVYIPNRKLLRLLALEVLEVKFNLSHVLIHIARRDDGLGALDEFLLIIHAVEEDRDASLLSDEIEPLLPVGIEGTCALGGDAQDEAVSLLRLVGKVVGHARMLASPYGDAAHLAEDRSQGPKEPLLLHQEVALGAFGVRLGLTEYQIPVAGMRCQANDVFLGNIHRYLLAPT